MTVLYREARRPLDPPAGDGFEVSDVPDDGAEHRVPLAQAWAVPLEEGLPVRRFTSRKGQRHLSGLWWSATTGGHGGRPPRLEGRGRTRQLPLQFGHVRPRRVPRAHGPIPPRASGLRRIVVRVGHLRQMPSLSDMGSVKRGTTTLSVVGRPLKTTRA